MKTKKDEIQERIINKIIENNFRGIVLSSVRSGKTRILLKSIEKRIHSGYDGEGNLNDSSILILYPNIDIKKSWENECKILDLNLNITYSTFASINKVEDKKFDFICVDEAHLLAPDTQLLSVAKLCKNNKHVILASGTYSDITLEDIQGATGLRLIVNYSTEDAINDGIVNKFSIYVHKYSLNNLHYTEYGGKKKWMSTEKKECNRLGNRIIKTHGKAKMFAALNRMRFINSCDSLINKVKQWILDNPDERFILFSGSENIGEKYNLPMFNSKSEDDSVLQDFISGNINQLCLIKKGSAGVTYPNLRTILITAINSNGENLEQMLGRSLLNDTDDAKIHIFVSDEKFQLKWLESALSNINKNKIVYIN